MRIDPYGNAWYNPFSWSNKTKIIVGASFIAVGIVATIATGGAALPAIIAAAKAVTISVSISAGIGSVAGGIENVIDGGSFLDGALSGAKQGAIDGFMWGGVFTGGSQILSSGFKVARTLAPGFNGIKFGSSFKVFSPNSSTNPNIGGTILKFGKTFRLDVESYQLLHFHTAIFGKAHISITQWLGGLFGGLSR